MGGVWAASVKENFKQIGWIRYAITKNFYWHFYLDKTTGRTRSTSKWCFSSNETAARNNSNNNKTTKQQRRQTRSYTSTNLNLELIMINLTNLLLLETMVCFDVASDDFLVPNSATFARWLFCCVGGRPSDNVATTKQKWLLWRRNLA